MEENEKLNAEVIAVLPNKVKISVDDLENFQLAEEKLKVGSYLRIADNDNAVLIAIIENFNIEVGVNQSGEPNRKYILEANPLGIIRNGQFENNDLAKYRASRESIERIAKEGRKYGVSLLLASQRPSEISETIFSQCNNFLALRLTNPADQNYVKRLLPDTLGSITEKMPSLKVGECLLMGDAVVLPSIVQIEKCDPEPSSRDIPYLQLWKEAWHELDSEEIIKLWEH